MAFRSRMWHFEYSNGDEDVGSVLLRLKPLYVIYYTEVSLNHGFIYFAHAKTLQQLQKVFSICNMASGTPQENRKQYMSKGHFQEIGVLPLQGKRTDLQHSACKDKDVQKHKCACGYEYKYMSGLSRHKLKCIVPAPTPIPAPVGEVNIQSIQSLITPELVIELIRDNKELKNIILEQNNTINTLVQNGIVSINTTNNNNNNNINSNNKTFNLHIFLNETCKDAMNMTDFVDSIDLQLSDLESVGQLGYAQGISNIITKKLQELDVTMRPVHCTDQKRETIYIKDDNKWEKEDDEKTKIRKLIRSVVNKNKKLLPQFREKNPEYKNSKLKISDKYDKIVLEAMGGICKSAADDANTENKIIRNITNCTVIEKS